MTLHAVDLVKNRSTCRVGVPDNKSKAAASSQVSMNPSVMPQITPGGSAAPSASSRETNPHELSECQRGGGSAGVAAVGKEGPGLRKVREFILKIRPNEVEESGPSWQELQLQPTPTLLPNLRYVLEMTSGEWLVVTPCFLSRFLKNALGPDATSVANTRLALGVPKTTAVVFSLRSSSSHSLVSQISRSRLRA